MLGKMARSRIASRSGGIRPSVRRFLSEYGQEVIALY